MYNVCRFEFDSVDLRGSLEVEIKGSSSLEIIARNGDAFIGVPISVSGKDGQSMEMENLGQVVLMVASLVEEVLDLAGELEA